VGSAYVQIPGIKTGTGISSEMAVDAADLRVKRIIELKLNPKVFLLIRLNVR
jgi:hypothetical protein